MNFRLASCVEFWSDGRREGGRPGKRFRVEDSSQNRRTPVTIKVEVDKISPSDHGLALGLVVRYGEGGPVRFVQAYVPIDLFDAECRAALLVQWNRLVSSHFAEEPLF